MLNIWAKVLVEDKIVKHLTLQKPKFNKDTIISDIAELMLQLDLPTPIIMQKHLSDFKEYNKAVFTEADFIEPIYFQKLVIELY